MRISDEFLAAILEKFGKKGGHVVLNESLTKTEKVMLAKRFAAVSMLGEGLTFEHIYESLNMSPSTIARFWSDMQRGKYRFIISELRKKKAGKTLSERLLDAFIGPFRPVYSPRWKWLDDI